MVKLRAIEVAKEGSIQYLPRKISSPSDCVELIRKYIDESDREMFIVITLDTKQQPALIQTCSLGTLNSSLVHPREVYKLAVLSNANTIIVGHNHPSGVSKPSESDRSITRRLEEAGSILGIKLLDHIIIGADDYYSFKENEEI